MPRGVSLYDEARLQGRLLTPRAVPSIVAWWDAGDITTFGFSSANLVSSWTDKIGGAALVQATTSGQPTLLNGVVTFAGTTNLACNQPASFPTANAPAEMAFVGSASGTGTSSIIGYGDTATSFRGMASTSVGNLKTTLNLNANFLVTTTSLGTAKYVGWSIPAVGATSTAWIDGTSAATGTEPTETAWSNGKFYVTNGSGSGTTTIRQILVANAALSTPARQKLEGWASWGPLGLRGSNLPASHPFKNRPPLIGD